MTRDHRHRLTRCSKQQQQGLGDPVHPCVQAAWRILASCAARRRERRRNHRELAAGLAARSQRGGWERRCDWRAPNSAGCGGSIPPRRRPAGFSDGLCSDGGASRTSMAAPPSSVDAPPVCRPPLSLSLPQ
jgi:hypothetical protein